MNQKKSNAPPRSLTILQWNAQSLPAHGDELQHYLDSSINAPSVICIQETWLTKDKDYELLGYKEAARVDRETGYGGVAIYVRTEVPHRKINIKSSLECCAVEIIKSKGKSLAICNIYHAESSLDETLLSMVRRQLPNQVLFVGDYNSHNELWGGRKTDRKGKVLESFIDEHGFVLLNDGRGTRLAPNGSTSALDLSFTTPRVAAKCTWSVDYSSTLGSDHFPVTTTIGVHQFPQRIQSQSKFNMKKANWELFTTSSGAMVTAALKTDDVETFYKGVKEAILKAARAAIPISRSRSTSGKLGAPWWNEECTTAAKNRKKAMNRIRRTRLPDDYTSYKEAKATFSTVIEEAKAEYWKSYCSGLSELSTVKDVWERINLMTQKPSHHEPINLLLDESGSARTDPTEIANLMADQYERASSDSNLTEDYLTHRAQFELEHHSIITGPAQSDDAYNDPFTMEEMVHALATAKDTSPGEDSITISMLRHLPVSSREVLLDLFNETWRQQQLPEEWRHSKVIPVTKHGKDPTRPESHRPISLTSCTCKLLERMIKRRLIWFLEGNNLLNPCQSGFRPNRSTLDNLIKLEDSIQFALHNGEYVVAVTIDQEKAFDLLWRNGLLVKLYNIGIRGNMFGWIRSFLSERTSQVMIGRFGSRLFSCTNGTPQGSVLSPDLYTAMTNDIATHKTKCNSGKFADDETRWFRHKDLQTLKHEIEKDLKQTAADYKKHGFKIAAGKTAATVFTLKKVPKDFSIQLGNTSIPVGRTVKILGITFDSRLTWKSHIDSIEKRCTKTLHLLRRITGFNWGAQAAQLLMIYRALIRSKMDYGGALYESASNSAKHQLDVIQSKALKICLGLPKSTANASTLIESGEMPLDLRRNLSTVHNYIRLSSLPQKTTRNELEGSSPASFYNRATAITNDSGVTVKATEKIKYNKAPPWRSTHPVLNITSQPSSSKITYNSYVQREWQDYLQIYTDGARAEDGRSSSAFIIPSRSVKVNHRISGGSTVAACELTAIYLAMKWAESSGEQRIAILSDSREALNIVCSSSTTKYPSQKSSIVSMWNTMTRRNCTVKFVWIKARAGVRGNEAADAAAKRTLSAVPTISIRQMGADLKPGVGDFITLQWQKRWNTAATSTDAFVRRHSPNVTSTAAIFGRTRREQVLLTRMRTNTLMLNYRRNQIGAHPSGHCDNCPTVEDVAHILLKCPKYKKERETMAQKVSPEKPREINLPTLLDFGNEITRSAVLRFLEETGISRRLKLEKAAQRAV